MSVDKYPSICLHQMANIVYIIIFFTQHDMIKTCKRGGGGGGAAFAYRRKHFWVTMKSMLHKKYTSNRLMTIFLSW